MRFADSSAFCEVEQGPALAALLAALACRDIVTVRLQNRWRWVFVSAAAIILALVAGYLWGLPWGAKLIAPHVPVAAMRPLSKGALAQLDKHLLKPSRLPQARQQALRNGFLALAATDPGLAPYGEQLSLVFRAAPAIGPNAFALPDGQIILFDELVALHDGDEEILAVLSHELGHLHGRHSIRLLIQSSAVAAIAAAWFGDISYAITAVSTVLLNSAYSRDMEREADEYAADMLRGQGKSPALLADALEKMDAFYRAEKAKAAGEDERAGSSTEKVMDWLSSHPGTEARIQRLRGRPDTDAE